MDQAQKPTNHIKTVSIGCASAFWGDTTTAALQLLQQTRIDYIVFDYLSEITMALLAKDLQKNPEAGGAINEFLTLTLKPLLPQIAKKRVKIISNAGGLNPQALSRLIQSTINQLGLSLKVGTVTGDNVPTHLLKYTSPRLLSSNAYLGATPIAQALSMGADIVITGRVVDSALTLGPLMHEFRWSSNDYDKLAQGSLAGHLIECGTQVTGGNFTDWQLVNDFSNMGFPIVECYPNGDFVLAKAENTGGMVTNHTVLEQLFYEVHNPYQYELPDVCCDFSQVQLKPIGPNRIAISHAKGMPPTHQYKVLLTEVTGYKALAYFLIVGPQAKDKARLTVESLMKKIGRQMLEKGYGEFTEMSVDYLGSEACYRSHARIDVQNTREIMVRLGVSHSNAEALTLFTREIAQAATAMPPGLVSLLGGRPNVQPSINVTHEFLDKKTVPLQVTVCEQLFNMTVFHEAREETNYSTPIPFKHTLSKKLANEKHARFPLSKLALTRSGDKGNDVNIAVIARNQVFYQVLQEQLTEDLVTHYFHDFVKGTVKRYDCPHLNTLNFVLTDCLNGGGMTLSQADPQGKGFGQMLLDLSLSMPVSLMQDTTKEVLHDQSPLFSE